MAKIHHLKQVRSMVFKPELVKKARELRKNSSSAEITLWEKLKARQIKNYRFLRQKVIGNYIVDFYCNKLKLVIEIDGKYHSARPQEDHNRQKTLELSGMKILRFRNDEVKGNLVGAIQTIIDKIEEIEANI